MNQAAEVPFLGEYLLGSALLEESDQLAESRLCQPIGSGASQLGLAAFLEWLLLPGMRSHSVLHMLCLVARRHRLSHHTVG